MNERKRILTGIRPTGALHLGHYAGALENWVRLQEEYECYFLIADYQVSDYADDISRVRDAVWDVALDWLAVGLDPEGSHYVIESLVPEHAELTTWLSWWMPLGMLQRNPTLKAEMEGFGKKSVPVAFFNYPVMQVSNILMPRAHLVPVGEDQLPHIEMTREIARRFNRQFKEVFPEPEGLVGRVPRLVGTDGKAKMSKSMDNAIFLSDDAAVVAKKVRRMFGGPPRGADEPGDPEENPMLLYLSAFDPDQDEVANMKEQYSSVGVSNKVLKERLTTVLNDFLDPIRDRRAKYQSNISLVREAIEKGVKEARVTAGETMEMVRDAMDLNYMAKY